MSPPNDEGKSGKRGGPAWRGNRKAGGKVKATPDWKTHKPKDSNDELKFRVKRTLLWIGCVALFVAFVLFLIPPRNTPLVVFRASEYPLQFPPLALAQEDESYLRSVSPSNLPLLQAATFRFFSSNENQTDEDGTPERFLSQLKSIKPSGPGWFSRNAVIIHIAAHGLVNENGQACLVPPNADAYDTRKWLPLSKFLKDICTLPNLQGARKLVVLDCNRISTKWRSGVLDNRFADQLPSVVKQVADPDLYVLNSTSPGQIGWAAPELRGSVFGHFLGRGLRGEASLQYPNDRKRYVVTLVELRDYLAANVDHYVRERRGARQVPMLICGPDGEKLADRDDVPIVAADWWLLWRTPEPPRAPYDVLAEAKKLMEPNGSQPASLQLAWEAYQRRAAAQTDDRTSDLPAAWRRGFILDPVRWAALEQRLLALEERLFAGEDYQKRLASQLAAIAAELSSEDWQEFPETQSANNLRLTRWKALAAAASRPSDEVKAQDLSQLYDEWLKAAPEAQPRISFPDDEQPRAIRELINRFGLDQEPDLQNSFEQFNFDRLASVLKFLRLPADAPPVVGEQYPVEAHFLKLLSSSSSLNPTAERLLPVALRTRSLAEQAATPLDIRTHYALELLVNRADAERRGAEDMYFLGDQGSLEGLGVAGDDAERNSAERRWSRAQGFFNKEHERIWEAENTGYLAARRWGEQLGEMFLLRDEIWATMPYLSEWYFRRWRLELVQESPAIATFQQNITALTAVLDLNIVFSEQLERLLSKRDREQDLREELSGLAVAYTTLKTNWDSLRALPNADSEVRSKAEIRFQPGDEVRRIEQVMHTPLYHGARVQDLLSKYHLTLVEWSNDMPEPPARANRAAKKPAAEDTAATPVGIAPEAADEIEFLEGYRAFLIRYHRVLSHEFKKPYEKDLELLRLDKEHQFAIDRQVRQPSIQKQSLWQTLGSVLGDYNVALGKNPVSVGTTTRADQARDELSVWDRRVRTSAFWLGCFNRDLNAPALGIPTPTAWLREVDHWHLTCWHGYRVLQDFWGNGLPGDRGRQFFDLVAEHCSRAAQAKNLPFQYDIAGAKVENLEDLQEARKVAHSAGLEVQVPPLQSPDPVPADGVPFEAKTTQRIEADRQAASFPPGFAGFYLSRAGVVKQLDNSIVEYLGNPRLNRAPVELFERLSNPPGPRPIAGKIQATKLEKPPVALEGRVWYRGHIWSSAFDLYHEVPRTGIKFVHRRESYSAPTVQVTGDGAPSGAVMFVFDMSASMATPDMRFAMAHAALTGIIKDLKTVPDGLKVGLMAYGHRTPNVDDWPKKGDQVLYKRALYHDSLNNLTPAGEALKADLARFPHPDRDIEPLLRPDAGWPDLIEGRLASLKIERCLGVTPLYAAIADAVEAVEAVPGVDSHQVIVLSDGVNMPYNCAPDRGWIDAHQNDLDFKELKRVLAKSRRVKVRVVLFGGLAADPPARAKLELAQLAELQSAGPEPGFVVDVVPKLEGIKKSIMDAFEKPTFEVVAADRERPAVGRLPFNSIWTYPQWPAPGDLLVPQAHQVVVRGPRLSSPLVDQLQLGGGEALLIDYQGANAKLEYLPDLIEPFYRALLERNGNYSGPDLPVPIETVKPIVGPPNGETRPTTFRLRMGSKDNRRYIPWPRHVWAEIRPLNPPAKFKDLNFQIADLKFEDKTRTPILHFPIPNWPIAAEGAAIDIWLRYGSPAQFPSTTISPADQQLPAIAGKKFGLEGVEFRVQQQIVEGTSRKITVTERHPTDTPLARLYRTRVQLSPPADVIERLYIPASGTSSTSEVVHTFHYTTQVYLAANVTLNVNTADQIKDGSLRATLKVEGWDR